MLYLQNGDRIVVTDAVTSPYVFTVRRMNEVNARRARLVPGWVTVFGHLGM